MHVEVALYGSARVVVGQARVDVAFDAPSTTTIGQVVGKLITTYPRVQPYVLDEAGRLPFNIRILINEERPNPDATLATLLHDGDRLALLVAVAGGGADAKIRHRTHTTHLNKSLLLRTSVSVNQLIGRFRLQMIEQLVPSFSATHSTTRTDHT